ncbi:L-seryl-tRNA(Ser) seleniumtransferase [Saccharomonospora amisosensis]|uniref:L-seryl-tRNA(Sec) selenium transferase n=1 Tax=Saccharomonospora amisosensis TaxID=1128677 RepID=A0A7X5UPG7_9PSEU|nr:L-seryl-tRNA(Sec) selenium transferase [Saccharomonospora amisosensis]NIJ11823.1 L-seryl-tRNA(Ser) seleniumtransferase [Saccharomonospora amisosensis]
MTDPRRHIPRTDTLLAEPRLAKAAQQLGTGLVKEVISAAQQSARRGDITAGEVAERALAMLPPTASSLRPVLNATGVIVHTNLGRAPLSVAALDAVHAAGGSTDVEFDLTEGRRAGRGRGALAALACAVPDAADVHVVNNNAAALLLCALALARDKEIVISKGELVEIGDGFRIPDLLEGTGARLREVGATNRTTVADYAEALGPDTAFVLKVHPSNFRVTGFTSQVPIAQLAALGAPVVADIGSGLLRPDPLLPDEPDATTALREGATLVTASGDKLLGGPQAGLLLGDSALVRGLRGHPCARALRVDKLTLAALEATLRGPTPPVRAALDADAGTLLGRAKELASALRRRGVDAHPVASVAAVGGGGAPGIELPSAAVSIPAEHAARLRRGQPPVVGRVEKGRCLLDLRTVDPDDDERLLEAVSACTS